VQSQVKLNRVPEKVPEKVWVAWVQSQVRFNNVPEKVPEKVWEASGPSQVRFNRVPEKVPEKVLEKVLEKVPEKVLGGFGAEKVWEPLVQSQFNRVPEKVSGGFGAEPGQVQQGSGEGVGSSGAEPGQVLQGSGEDSGEGSGEGSGRLWCRALSGGFRRRFRTRCGRLWCRTWLGSTRFRRRFWRRFWRRFREALVQRRSGILVQSQVRFNRVCGHLTHGNPAEVFPALVFAARFRKICKNKMLRLLGIPPKLIFHFPKPKKRHADAPKQAEPAPFAFPREAVAPVSGLQSAQNNDTGMQHPNISPDYECNNMLSPGREICQS